MLCVLKSWEIVILPMLQLSSNAEANMSSLVNASFSSCHQHLAASKLVLKIQIHNR